MWKYRLCHFHRPTPRKIDKGIGFGYKDSRVPHRKAFYSMPGRWFVLDPAEHAGCSTETWIPQPAEILRDSRRTLGNAPLFPILGNVIAKHQQEHHSREFTQLLYQYTKLTRLVGNVEVWIFTKQHVTRFPNTVDQHFQSVGSLGLYRLSGPYIPPSVPPFITFIALSL